MPVNVPPVDTVEHVRLADPRARMAKAGIRKADDVAWREAVGRAIERTLVLSGLRLQQFAARIGRNERTVARWISGEERPQLDVIFAADDLRPLCVIALAEQVREIEIATQITVRRRA